MHFCNSDLPVTLQGRNSDTGAKNVNKTRHAFKRGTPRDYKWKHFIMQQDILIFRQCVNEIIEGRR